MIPTSSVSPSRGGFHNLPTVTKLLLCFLASSVLMLGIGGFGIWSIVQRASVSTSVAVWTLVGAMVVTFIATMAIGSWVARQIAQPLQAMVGVAERVANGDVTPIDDLVSAYGGTDETGKLVASFKSMIDNLREQISIAERVADGDLTSIEDLAARYRGNDKAGKLIKALHAMITDLRAQVEITERIADGELPEIDSLLTKYAGRDKSGQSMKALQHMIVNLREQIMIADRVANGDLKPIDDLAARYQGNEKSGKLVKALHTMITNLRMLVISVTDASQSVSSTSYQIAQAAEQTGLATVNVSQAIEQVSHGAQDQSQQLIAASQELGNLLQQSESMQHESGETLQAMETVKHSIALTAEQVRKLGTRSTQIGQIVEAIDEIAEQTNLLALNAAIEAARAGEHGRGFAVVADEVRKLAERSANSTKEIGVLIRETQAETTEAVSAMEKGVVQVEDGLRRVVNAQQSAQAMTVSTQKANEAITNVAAVSEENGAAAEEVSAATEEMSAQVEETVAATSSLSSLTNELLALVNDFKLGSDVSASHNRPLTVEEASEVAPVAQKSTRGKPKLVALRRKSA
ncbi:MAG: methyl-accepting chemotaxis protein [Ktedonobacterales bacterium]|nr:methyl-accepting chemotaxis protein [Ktedonobacterales bacterium]